MKKQKGIALITVLMVMALVAIIGVEMSKRLRLEVTRADNLLSQQQTFWYAMAGESFAKRLLSDLKDKDPVHLGQDWAAKDRVFPLPDGGELAGEITDGQACFNLNALRQDDDVPKAKAMREAFLRLIEAMEIEELSQFDAEAMANALYDYLDDGELLFEGRSDSAEDSDYASKAFPYLPPNNYMISAGELRQVENFDVAKIQALLPYTCVLPQESELQINVNTIDEEQPELLMAALKGLSKSDASSIISNRPDDGWDDIDEFFNQSELVTLKDADKETAKELLSVTSRWFVLQASTKFNGSEVHLYSLLKADNDKYFVVSRRLGELM